MPQFSAEFWLQIAAYAASCAGLYSAMAARLTYLEKKVDSHAQAMERFCRAQEDLRVLEERVKNDQRRLNNLEEGRDEWKSARDWPSSWM